MHIQGIDEITFGANDLGTCRKFFLDWGLALVAESEKRLEFECLNGCRVVVADSATPGLPAGVEPDPTLREVVWCVDSPQALDHFRQRLAGQPGFVDAGGRIGCTDPNGLAIRIQVTRKRPVQLASARTNTWTERTRINQPAPAYDRATPVEVGRAVAIGDFEGYVHFIERDTGRTLARVRVGSQAFSGQPIAIDANQVLVQSRSGNLALLRIQ